MLVSRAAKALFCAFDILLKSVALITAVVGLSTGALAASLSLNESANNVPVGTPVALDVDISGLNAGGPDSLGSFDLNITFDSTILVPTGVTFGNGLGDPDPLAFETVSSMTMPDGSTINIAMTSFLADLSFQLPAFTLATINFDTLAVGSSPVLTAMEQLFDEFADPLALDQSGETNITVIANASIPLPSSLLLMVGILGLGYLRRASH